MLWWSTFWSVFVPLGVGPCVFGVAKLSFGFTVGLTLCTFQMLHVVVEFYVDLGLQGRIFQVLRSLAPGSQKFVRVNFLWLSQQNRYLGESLRSFWVSLIDFCPDLRTRPKCSGPEASSSQNKQPERAISLNNAFREGAAPQDTKEPSRQEHKEQPPKTKI